jgi:endoglucanase
LPTRVALVLAVDDAYAIQAATVVASLVATQPTPVRTVVVHAGLSRSWRRSLQGLADALAWPLELRAVPAVTGVPVYSYASAATYLRLLAPDVVGAERLIYLDADLLVEASLAPLADMRLTTPIAAVQDHFQRTFETGEGLPGYRAGSTRTPYFNAGVMVIDTAQWRRARVTERALAFLRESPEHVRYWDQCALNAVLEGAWTGLDPAWNCFPFNDLLSRHDWRHQPDAVPLPELLALEARARIVHFVGPRKPWDPAYRDSALRRRYRARLTAARHLAPGASGPDARAEVVPFRRGVNLGGWLSQVERNRSSADEFLTGADIDRIAGLGFDHVRLPVDEHVLYPGGPGSPPATDALDRVAAAVVRARGSGLGVIVDLHQTAVHTVDGDHEPAGSVQDEAEALLAFWLPLLAHLPKGPGLALDLLNEPADIDPAAWNEVIAAVVREIRRRDGVTWLLAEAADGADIRAAPLLPSPPPPRTIYGFHFYAPRGFTHQSASWSRHGRLARAPQPYPGRLTPVRPDLPVDVAAEVSGTWDLARLQDLVLPCVRWASQQGVPLHCGEFGAYVEGPVTARHAWVGDVRRLFEACGVGWCYWSYKNMGFGIVYETERRRRQREYASGIDRGLVGALLPASEPPARHR